MFSDKTKFKLAKTRLNAMEYCFYPLFYKRHKEWACLLVNLSIRQQFFYCINICFTVNSSMSSKDTNFFIFS